MTDYFLVQVINLLVKSSDGTAVVNPLDEIEEIPFVNKIKGTDPFWKKFDLNQTHFVPGLNVNIKSPLIVLPDLGSAFGGFAKRFELDLGTVKITTKLVEKEGRWKHFPDKTLKMMQVRIENTDLKFDFRERESRQCTIFFEKQIDLDILLPNSSPYFLKPESPDYNGPYFVDREGNMFDPSFLDTSLSVKVT
jgi:hypothetical protein